MKFSVLACSLISIFLNGYLCEAGDRVYYSSLGIRCKSNCEKKGYSYAWCKLEDPTGEHDWDYCSQEANYDSRGLECKITSSCGHHGYPYKWCYLEKGSWGYCGTITIPMDPVKLYSVPSQRERFQEEANYIKVISLNQVLDYDSKLKSKRDLKDYEAYEHQRWNCSAVGKRIRRRADIGTIAKIMSITLGTIKIVKLLFGFIPSTNSELMNFSDETILLTTWMHVSDPKLNGCGLKFSAIGYRNHKNSVSVTFPDYRNCKCDDENYILRIVGPSETHEGAILLGNDRCKEVKIEADGFEDTHISKFCIGFNKKTIQGGPRSFCVNQAILKKCQEIVPENFPTCFDNSSTDIKFTRSFRGIKSIVLSHPERIMDLMAELAAINSNSSDPLIISSKVFEEVREMCGLFKISSGEGNQNHCDARGFFVKKCSWWSSHLTVDPNIKGIYPYGCNVDECKHIKKNLQWTNDQKPCATSFKDFSEIHA